MYSDVISTNRAPASVKRRASKHPSPNRPVSYASYDSFGSSVRSKAFAAGDRNNRSALSIDRNSDSR